MLINKKIRKILLVVVGAIIALVVVVILFISPITKFLVEKYSIKLLGRQVKMSWVYVNPFTGYVYISNLKIYEYQSDSVFLTANSASAGFAMLKMFSKTYEITSLTLDKPRITFRQNHKWFNLEDVIERFTPKGPPDSTKGPVHFNLLNMGINDGVVYYRQEGIPINYFIKKLDLKSSGLRWNADTIGGSLTFENGPAKGDVKADFTINIKSLDYKLAAVINKFELNIIEQYLHELANYGSLSANLDADIKGTGNFKDQLDVDASGYMAVNDMHFGKDPGADYASFKKLALKMIEINPKNYRYYFDTVSIDTPFFKYERYDYLDNLQRMFGKNGENITAAKADQERFNLIIEIADYIKVLAQNFIQSYYKINKLAIYRGNIKFADYSQREKFAVAASPLYLVSDTIDKSKERMVIDLKTGLQPYGKLSVNLSLDPNDYGYFDLDYKVQNIPVSLFNPYLISYTSFPLDRGTLEFKGNMVVEDSNVNAQNHLLILDPRVGKRLEKKDTKWVPMPLIMSIVRERNEVIDYQIPIKGRLSDPKFKLWNVIGHIVTNVFVKPPSTPYLVEVKHLENKVEKSLTLKWETRESRLSQVQGKFIKKVADFLKTAPDAAISISQMQYSDKEKEYILFFEAKKKYFLNKNGLTVLTEKDSVFVDKMSPKDSAFVRYINGLAKDSMLFTIQEKCNYYVGNKIIDAKYNTLLKEREANFSAIFKEEGVDSRVKFVTTETGVPFNGFSYYTIDYKGEFPESLIKAYERMDQLNEEPPREKYEKEREKNSGGLSEEEEIKQGQLEKLQ